MKIYVDGDACPVIGVIEKIAKKKGVTVVIVCDEMHDIYSDYCQVVKVPCGYDAVDMKIAVDVHKNDIVVTQDYGVAAMVLAKGASVITRSGFQLTNSNIDLLLFERNVAKIERKKTRGCIRRNKGSMEPKVSFYDRLSGMIDKEYEKEAVCYGG